MQFQEIRFEQRDKGAWIIFDHPERMNAITPDWIREVGYALRRAERDPAVRAVVLTGSGPAFCAGVHLKSTNSMLGGQHAEIITELLEPLTDLLRQIRRLPKPVIASVNGYCMAGGLETVLCCDLIIAAEEGAVFSDAHARYGLLPAIGGAQGLVRALGPFKAKEMLFTADRFTARQMEAAGLVNRVVPDAQLHKATEDLVATLAERSSLGLRRMKQMVNEESDMPWDAAARYELTITEAHLQSEDIREGLQAFVEKRRPSFK